MEMNKTPMHLFNAEPPGDGCAWSRRAIGSRRVERRAVRFSVSNIGFSIFEFVSYFGIRISCFPSVLIVLLTAAHASAGHSRSCYLDAGQSVDGRYVVTARRNDTFDTKGKRIDHRWTFTWQDRQSGEKHEGELLGLRTGTDNVFDPVNAHIFVAPGGDTFALWMPQSGARAANKNPGSDDRSSDQFQSYEGFGYRLTIYQKTGDVVQRFDLKDFLNKADWAWMHFHGRQVYWLVEYGKLDTRQTPRSGHALFRISPDYTILEFQVGANSEATHHAKQRGTTPPDPRVVRVRLTDGRIVTGEELVDSNKIPVRPFVGDPANKERPQYAYEPSLDPVREPGRFVERDRTKLPVQLGRSSPEVK